MTGWRIGALAAALAAMNAAGAAAQDSPAPGEPAFALRYSLKGSGLLSRLPDAPILFPDRDSATMFWRFRLEPSVRVSDTVRIELAGEQRFRLFSSAAAAPGGAVLPPGGAAPFRIRQLDWQVSSSPHSEWRAEVDRAAVHVTTDALSLTVGRQAIGWGRGVLFSAVDLFAPFTPLEADREWRRGVDAVRADVKLASRASVEAVGAFGADADHSIVAARLRGYAGDVDVELLGGKRAQDRFGGVTTSAAVGDAEVHAELALFRTAASSAGDRSVVKAVAGGSYRVPVAKGLLVYGEYHYSGFGAASAGAIPLRLADPDFQERYLRGDTQILGRHAVAALASYEWSPELSLAAQWLQSPVDGSGVLVSSSTLTFGDHASLVVTAYVPYGKRPAGTAIRSEFGATPLALFVQTRIYR